MVTTTVGRAGTRDRIGAARLVAYLGAAAFLVATVWYELVTERITVAPEPVFGPGDSPSRRLELFYRWLATTLGQERLVVSIAIAGFLCLVAVAALVRDLLGRERPLARIGAGAVTAGSLLWIAGNLGQLGGHRAVALMAAHGNPIDAVNSIAFTVDIIDQAFELAAFALAGAGLLAFARLALRPGGELRRWGGCTAALALLLLALAWSYAGGSDRLNNLLLAAGGILLPLWLIWTGRLLDPGT